MFCTLRAAALLHGVDTPFSRCVLQEMTDTIWHTAISMHGGRALVWWSLHLLAQACYYYRYILIGHALPSVCMRKTLVVMQ